MGAKEMKIQKSTHKLFKKNMISNCQKELTITKVINIVYE
jgi:hypothetical protein